MNIHIPNPCNEDWSRMQPEAQGRFCAACSKTVVDFTNREPEAIMAWLQQRQGQKVCGRFTADQLKNAAEPVSINWPGQIGLSALSCGRKVAAVIIVVFGLGASSCNDKTDNAAEKHAGADSSTHTALMGVILSPVDGSKDSGIYPRPPLVADPAGQGKPPIVTVTRFSPPRLHIQSDPEPMIVGELAVPEPLLPVPPPPPPVPADSTIMVVGQLLLPPVVKARPDSLLPDSLKTDRLHP